MRDDAAADALPRPLAPAVPAVPAPVDLLLPAAVPAPAADEMPATGRPTCPSVTSMPSRSAWMDAATRDDDDVDVAVDSLLLLAPVLVFSALLAVGVSSLASVVAPPCC